MIDLHCDRCGAMGQARFLFPNGMDLVFCNHHRREYFPELSKVAVEDVTLRNYELMEV